MSRKIDPRNIEVIDDDLAAVLRAKTPAERIAMIAAANRTARLLARAGIRYQHPDWDESQIHAEVLRRVCSGTN
jgi:Rv0078B-related antitoxin